MVQNFWRYDLQWLATSLRILRLPTEGLTADMLSRSQIIDVELRRLSPTSMSVLEAADISEHDVLCYG